ncbi:MAG: glycosyltransferase family 4 protein [Lunatimonas sp.]|uniref:glycosyltransferase family 4 protein n=1 Tax=Lunatimonas sp. TaxID=2060141 RepID=UPI00263B7055|nr:glycosyltransferase family 4 protein [Lunatimonas sp.]MCC5938715.1 glycosyltransferase family 4 protein [Lunatimonas sp.]
MLVYIAPIKTAFIQRDLEMLKEHTRIKFLTFTDNPLLLPAYFLIQFIQLIVILPATNRYLCFFGGYHTVIPVILGKLFRKKVIIQCGGTDAMHLPHINYGNYRKKWLRWATVFSFRNCSLIVPVSEALVSSEYRYDSKVPALQGLRNLIPGLKTPIQVVYNGFDTNFWNDPGNDKVPFSFVTVATGISMPNRAYVKGIDLILKLAQNYKQYHFTLVGDATFSVDMPNVIVKPKLSPTELRDIYHQHQFYLQLSASEGFPNALAESMLCGCIPLGSQVGEIPHIIDDTGFLLQRKDFHQLCAIVEGLKDKDLPGLRKKARNRIIEHFPYELRKEKLLQLISPWDSPISQRKPSRP